MENKPVKRSKYIMELSRDHHLGLLFCWKIKEGVKRNIEPRRIKKYVDYFWEHHLKAHFGEEETLLFNRIDDPLCSQAKTEHQLLINRLNELNTERHEYVGFAELLIKHIRFEEREVFPHLETALSLTILEGAYAFLSQQHSAPFKDVYPDEFWVHKK